jgi:adenylosuccinate synthase
LIVSSFEFLAPLRRGEWKGLLEGAQGALLDVDHGTYPFVTSSNCTIGGALTGTGLSMKHIGRVLGVYKAYCTRVGNGPFVTELHGEEGEDLRSRGAEFGATTGRPRRCGWFDAVAARYAADLNGLDEVVITKLDILSGLNTLKICTGYEIEGEPLEFFPNWVERIEKCRHIYRELPGWSEDISEIESWEGLPQNCRSYVEALEEEIRTPIRFVSNGAKRSNWIERG